MIKFKEGATSAINTFGETRRESEREKSSNSDSSEHDDRDEEGRLSKASFVVVLIFFAAESGAAEASAHDEPSDEGEDTEQDEDDVGYDGADVFHEAIGVGTFKVLNEVFTRGGFLCLVDIVPIDFFVHSE